MSEKNNGFFTWMRNHNYDSISLNSLNKKLFK
jgi:hypothetical protein